MKVKQHPMFKAIFDEIGGILKDLKRPAIATALRKSKAYGDCMKRMEALNEKGEGEIQG